MAPDVLHGVVVGSRLGQIDPFQLRAALDVGQAGAGERGATEKKHAELRHVGQRGKTAVAHSAAMGYPETCHLAEIRQHLEPFVGDVRRTLDVQLGEPVQSGKRSKIMVAESRPAEPERDEIFQAGQMHQARVGHPCAAAEIEKAEPVEPPQLCQARVPEIVVAQFEALQIGERGEVDQCGVGHPRGIAEGQSLQAAKLLQPGHSVVGDARTLKREMMQIWQTGEIARHGIGDRLASKRQLLEIGERHQHLDVFVARGDLLGLHADHLLAVVTDTASQPIDAIEGRLERRQFFGRGRLVSVVPENGQENNARCSAKAADAEPSKQTSTA